MIRDAQFSPTYSLSELRDMLNLYEGLWGGLVGIGNAGNDTVGSFDDALPGTHRVSIRSGGPAPQAGETVIATDMAFITAQLQQVTAYRT